MIHHLAPNGKIGLVLANGALSSQNSGEGEIRKNIIQTDLVEGIVALPTQLFYSVTIPVTLWFISKNKKQKGKTLFIDARKMGHMVDRKHRNFSDEDICKLSDTFEQFQDGTLSEVKGFCAIADLAEIEKQDFILTPGRYVGIEEQEDDGEPFEEKMTRLTAELSEMFAKSHELEDEIRKKLGRLGMKCTINSLVCDILDHYENNREHLLTGKAMIVAYSRPIAMKIYKRILELRPAWTEKVGVVMTSGNSDPEEWRQIIGNKSHKEALAKKFKDNDSPMKIAIVVDMWLTGFDVPSLATIYVYKPMAGHNLMQAIARVNRVFEDKEGGL